MENNSGGTDADVKRRYKEEIIRIIEAINSEKILRRLLLMISVAAGE